MRRDPVNQAASSTLSGDAGSGDESSGEALQRREAARHDEEERRVELVLRLVEVRGRTVVGYDAVWVCSVPNAHRLLLRGSGLIAGRGRATGDNRCRHRRRRRRMFRSGIAIERVFSGSVVLLDPLTAAPLCHLPRRRFVQMLLLLFNPQCSLGGKLFKQVDVNGDGSMEWEEFTGFCIETGLAVGGANSTLRVRSNVQRGIHLATQRFIFQTL